ncbi:putative 13-kDa protein [Citrus associated ampelovirus 1]|nr:putative 13-kDa protein [Citrus associated ampelovirus 1]
MGNILSYDYAGNREMNWYHEREIPREFYVNYQRCAMDYPHDSIRALSEINYKLIRNEGALCDYGNRRNSFIVQRYDNYANELVDKHQRTLEETYKKHKRRKDKLCSLYRCFYA